MARNNGNFKLLKFDPRERMAELVEDKGWEEDNDMVEMDMGDLSDIADGFKMIREGLELISIATGVDLGSV